MGKQQSSHLIGCNYWASNLAIYMWKKYDKQVIEDDMKILSSHGVNCIRVFPLWPDFQPLEEMRFVNKNADIRFPFKMRKGDTPLELCKFESGLDEDQVANFKHLLTTAEKYDIKVIVSFVTGWMSGRKLVPQPFISRDLVNDAEVVLYECAFIRDMIGEIKDHKNIIAYEPGNETNCLSYEINRFEAELWLKSITDTIRMADPTKPVYSGMHGTNLIGDWTLVTQRKYFDMVTPHPYPCFTEHCKKEKLTEMRASLHAAADSSYYRSIAGKPAMVQEIGVMGASYLSDQASPEYFEKACMTSFQIGSKGFLWWCGFDQDHLDISPYDTNAAESYLGLAYDNKRPKPVLAKLDEIRKATDEIGDLPDPIHHACAILCTNVEHWGNAYGSFVLGAQGGNYIDYSYETQPIKDYEYFILPSLGDNHGLNKYRSKELYEKIKNGAKLLVTYTGGVMWEQEEMLGLITVGNETNPHVKEFELNGKKLAIKCNNNTEFVPTTAKVLIRDTEGRIVLTENKVGKGSVMLLNAPIEMDFVTKNYPEKTDLYEVYKFFLKDVKKIVEVDDKKAFVTTYDLGNGKYGAMVYNYTDSKELPIKLADGYKVTKSLFGSVENGKWILDRNYAYIEISK